MNNEIKIITPLRYPGGKSKSIKFLKNYFPKYFNYFYEPFVGGGSIALYISRQYKVPVHINDLNKNLYTFWYILQNKPDELITELKQIRSFYKEDNLEDGKALLKEQSELLTNGTDFKKAVAFYTLNKISFSGLTEHGSLSKIAYKKTFNKNNISKLKEISNVIKDFKITNLDYIDGFSYDDTNNFMLCDPPYMLDKGKDTLYGKDGKYHKNFDHERFCNFIKSTKVKFCITYNDNKILREWYKDFYVYTKIYKYCMAKPIEKEEIIITNYEV